MNGAAKWALVGSLALGAVAHGATWRGTQPTTRLVQVITPLNLPAAEAGQAAPAYFYAAQFWFENDGGCGGYMGLQVDTGSDPAPRKAIFSVWCALTAWGPGLARPFSNEGNGYQTLVPFTWEAGRSYQLRLEQSAPTQWTAYVDDAQSGIASTIGTVQVPTQWGLLQPYTANFVEFYGARPSSCLAQPRAAVRFSAAGDASGATWTLDQSTLNQSNGTGVCTIPPSPPETAEAEGLCFVTGTSAALDGGAAAFDECAGKSDADPKSQPGMAITCAVAPGLVAFAPVLLLALVRRLGRRRAG